MTAAEPIQLATLIVTGGAVAFGLAAAVWAYRLTAGARQARVMWRNRLNKADDRALRAESVFAAHPGLVLVWDTPPKAANGDWAQPAIHGSPAALASMVSFAELGAGAAASGDAAAQILDALADFDASTPGGDTSTLRVRMGSLIEGGQPFSLTISGPSGRRIEADARPAGRRLVLWLTDPAVRGLECRSGSGEVPSAADPASADSLALVEAFGRAPTPAWRMNAAGRLIWVNPAYAEAVEVKAATEALDQQVMLEPQLAELAREALNTNQPQTAVRGAVVKGERRVMRLVVYPISGGAAGFGVDVTEGEDAKTALKRFRQAHDDTLNHMAEAVAIFDRAKRLVFYNRAFAELFSLEEAFLNERPSHAALLDRLREKRRLPEQADYGEWKQAELAHYEAAPGQAQPDELWPLPDGRTLRVARQRHPLGGVLLIFEDMTDQLSLQARYNTLIKVQRATLDKLHEAVAVFSTDGKLTLRNAAFEDMWALDPDTLDSLPFDEVAERCQALLPDANAWTDLKARVTDPSPEARKPVTGEVRRKDGKVLTFLTRPLPDGATLIAWDDITDSRRIESALRDRAEALEASERIKSEFVEHVSYQLRTPLTTIQGYADMIAAGLAGELNERQSDHMGAIQSASLQLGKLIDDILDIAAIDAGQLELELGDVNLAEVAEAATQLIASRAEHGGVKLSVNVQGAAALIRADGTRLKQVLYNLLTNALDHVASGGEIEIGADVDDGEARLWVTDDGEGIAPERQAKIFDRFERGEGGGAGLGLALVNDIVRLHGGWVAMESAPGEGTRVTAHLPVRASSDAAAPELMLPERGAGAAE
jgi:signal transduction histidine kinase